MKKLLLILLLCIPIVASSKMFPTEMPIKTVCWDNVQEAIKYHQDILGEYPIGRGWIGKGSFGAIMHNPTKPSWTFLNFHQREGGNIVVCAILGGSEWQMLTPGDDELEI